MRIIRSRKAAQSKEPAVRLILNQRGCPILPRPLRKGGRIKSPNLDGCHPTETQRSGGTCSVSEVHISGRAFRKRQSEGMMEIADSAAISARRKSGRAISAAILGGIAAASWGFHSYIWSRFMETQPRTPRPSEGLTYAMNNHGWVYYLSAAQSAQLDLLVYVAIATFILAAIISGLPQKKPWQKYAEPASLSSLIYFGISALLWTATLWRWSLLWASWTVSK